MLVKKKKKNSIEKKSKVAQSIYIWFRACYKYHEITKYWKKSQQHSPLSSKQKCYKISSQFGVFCRFLPLPCNQSYALLHFSISAFITVLTIELGKLDRAEEERSLAGLLSDIGDRPSLLNLRLEVPFGLEIHLQA